MSFGDTIAQTVLGKPTVPEDTNNAPNVIAEGAAVNTSVGITAHSTFANGNAGLTYSLAADSSAGGFKIDPNTGVVTVADPSKIDFETAPGHVYTITVQATKNSQFSSQQTFTISVNDVAPSTPVDSNLAANTVAEGAATGTAVGITASSTDVNGPAVTWSLTGDNSGGGLGGGFTINATTGVITVADGSKIDYESAPGHAYSVTATASDGTLTSSQTFSINVSDVGLPTPVDTNGAANSIAEGAANGSTVGITASAVDPGGPATTYSLTADSSLGGFTINSSTGVVTVANGAAINFETAVGHAYSITVQATNGAQTTSTAFSIGVTDVAPSTPVDTNGAADSVFEGAANGTLVGITASSIDPGGGPATTYSLIGDTSGGGLGGGFTINATTGVVTVADGTKIDYETAPGHAYNVTVQSTAGALSSTHTFSIGVGNVNEAPAGTDKAVLIAEDATYTFGVADFGFTDPSDFSAPNSLQAVKITTVPGAGAGTLTNNGNPVNAGDLISATDIAAGHLVFTPVLNANGSPEATFTFQVQDNGGTANGGVDLDQSPNTFIFNVTAVNDAPVNSVPGTQSVNEDATLTFSTGNGNAITISDVDVGAGNETVTLTVTSGTLALGSTAGLTSFTNNAASITLTGTVANVNAAMNGLTYHGNLNFNGTDSLAVITNDNGNTGSGGPKTDTDSIAINVAPVNDAPAGTNNTLTLLEDSSHTFTAAEFGFTDAVDAANTSGANAFQAVVITTIPGAGTGILTLDTGGGPVAVTAGQTIPVGQIGGLVFTPAANANGNGEASFTFQVKDDGGTANGGVDLDQSPNTIAFNVTSVNDAPAGTDTTISGQGAHTFVAADFGFTDPNDAAGAAGANNLLAVKITTIPGSGTLTNNGNPVAANDFITVADINAGHLVFTPTGNSTGSFTFQVQDDGGTSNGGIDLDQSPNTLTIIQDAAPVVTAGGTLNYTENQAATAIDPAVTVTDTDNANMASATVQISSGFAGAEDVLSANVAGTSITASYNTATGTLALSGSDTKAHYQQVLDSVAYANSSENPSGADRIVSYTVNDGTLNSNTGTATVHVAPVNDPPVTTAGGTLNYTENQAATVIDAGVTVSDVDNANMASATVQISGGFASGQDVLSANVSGTSITVSYDGGTGALSLSGSDTKAHYQQVLDSVAYFNSSENPSGADRIVSYTVNDGALNSNTSTSTIHVTPVNDPPVTTAGGTLTYTENQAATVIDASVTVSDVDNANIFSATVQISSGFASGQDVLSFNTAGTSITASYNGGSGLLTLSGSDTKAHYQQVLDSVAYSNSSENPSGADRIVSYTVNDGALNSNTSTATIHVTPVNDAPILTAGATASFTENGSAATVAGSLTLTDADDTSLAGGAVVTLTNAQTSDVLSVQGQGAALSGDLASGIHFVVDNSAHTVTFSNTDLVTDYQAALRLVQFSNTSEDPSTTTRTFTITADDGHAANHSGSTSTTLAVVAVDDPPVNTVPADSAVPTAFSNTDTAISGISVADVDAESGPITTQLSVTHGTIAVTLAGSASISAGVNGSATLTISGTPADVNATLANNVVFHSTDGYTGQADLTVVTSDLGHTGTGGPLTDTDTVHIGVVPQVWFIDVSNVQPGNGNGTAADPFHTIHDFNVSAGPGQNDYIVIKSGTYTGEGLNLQDGQQVWGSGETLTFTNPVNSATVTVLNGSGARPTINVTTASDQGIDLASNNTIHGVNITTAAGTTGLDDGNNSVGTLTVDHMQISGAGQAVDIDQGGALNVTLESVSSSGGAEGIQLAGTASSGAGLLSGTFSGGSGAISGSTTAGFMIGDGAGGANTGGTAVISYSGTISAGTGVTGVNIQDHSTGAVTLSGNLTHTGTSGSAIVLDDNSSNFTFSGPTNNLTTGTSNAINITDQSGGTVGFSGTLNIDTTSGTGINLGGTDTGSTFNFTGSNLTIDTTGGNGFVATGGGTLNVTGTGNHINSGSGTAVNISNTTIGASGVTFHDINSNSAASGIILNNTGSGGFTVTGDGGASSNHSGGQIVGSTGAGVSLTNTGPVSLNYLDITNSGTDGVNASGVNGFTLTHSNVTDTAGGAADEGLQFTNVTGTIALTNVLVSGSPHNNVFLQNNNTNLTAFNITNSTFQNNLAATGADGVLIEAQGTSVISAITIKGSTFSGNQSTGLQVQTEDTANIQNLTVGLAGAGNGNVFSNNNAGVDFDVSQNSDLTFSLVNNSFQNNVSQAINVFTATASGAGASVTGKIQSNIVGTQGILDSGSANGSGIRVIVKGGAHGEFTIDGNQIHEVANARAIDLEGFHTASGGGGVDFNVINNTVFQPTGTNQDLGAGPGVPLPLASIWISSDNETGGSGDELVRAVVSNNTVYDPTIWQPATGGEGAIYLQGNNFGGINAHLQIEGTGTVLSTIVNNNTISNDDDADGSNNIILDGNVALIAPGTSGPFPLLATAGGVQASSPTPGVTNLSQAELNSVVAAAIAEWAHAGASVAQLAKLSAITFSVADLAGNTIGDQAPGHIVIDTDAAGHGWFVDPTPNDNSEFTHAQNAAGTDLLTDPSNAAAGHLDLLTTVVHEMGHELGLPDLNAPADDLMYINLVDGERRLPDAADVAQANHSLVAAVEAALPASAQAATAAPIVIGTSGNDTINAGLGGKILFGGGGADNFVFGPDIHLASATAPAAQPITHVADYSAVQGDSFDFSALTSAFHFSGIADNSLVRAVEDSSGTFATLQINTAPDQPAAFGSLAKAGVPNWVNVAQLDGAHADDAVNVLLDSHLAVHAAHIHVDLLV